MQSFIFHSFILILIVKLPSTIQAASLRPYHRRGDLEDVRPASELGWEVPLVSGSHALPYPASDKVLKYLTIARGTISYECNITTSSDVRPAFVNQNTELYDVAPLAQNLADEDALHALVPKFCEYDYAELTNSTMNCVGRIYNEFGHAVVDLFGFNVPEFSIEITWAMPSPSGEAFNGFWGHAATIDNEWEVYRVETAGGAAPTSCQGHVNPAIDVAYAAEYWFYHR